MRDWGHAGGPGTGAGSFARVDHWLLSTGSERLRFAEVEAVQRRARPWVTATLVLSALLVVPFYDLSILWPLAFGVLPLVWSYRAPRRRHRALAVLAVVPVTEVLVVATVASTGGSRSPLLAMLLVAPATLTPRFGPRGLIVGLGSCAVIVGIGLAVAPAGHNATPEWLRWACLGLAAFGVFVSAIAAQLGELRTRAQLYVDPVTGVYSRSALQPGLAAALDQLRRTDGDVCAVVVDVDRFKAVNDDHGHAAGDRVLRRVAAALAERAVPVGGEVYRLGGDEFLVIIPGGTHDEADTLVAEVTEALRLDGGHAGAEVSISAGTAIESAAATDLGHLLDRADAAMYRRKRARPGLV